MESAKAKKEAVHWWEEEPEDDKNSVKWNSLEHHGVLFPPDYAPHGIPLLVDSAPLALSPQQEEIASWWAAVVGTEWETKELFRKNFEKNFLAKFSGVSSLSQCDFSLIKQHLEFQKEQRKSRPVQERKAEREAKQKVDQAMGYAIVDSTREKIMNIMVEPPGLFRGRGQHPKAGYMKTRLTPEDVTINVGKDNVVPICQIPGRAWKNVVHNSTVTWLAYYKDPHLSFSNVKYMYLAASSKFKGVNDRLKYEKARKLKNHIDSIRQDYMKKIHGEDMVQKQLGTALYLIDVLALRVGNEKSEDEADTVGCCSLRVEHIVLEQGNRITLDFLGKDSMRYFNTVQMDAGVYANLQMFVKGKEPSDDLFELINTSTLNEYLKECMEGLSAKVFRTFNASITLQDQLSKSVVRANLEEKVQFYTDANREVAILCNHQKSTPKNFDVQMEKMQDTLKEKLEHLRILQDQLRALEKGSQLPETAEKKLPTTVEKAKNAIARTKTGIKNFEIKLKMKDDNKTVALGTSKINYMDPRITIAWCKKNEVPIERIFPKTLRSKFMWAMYTEPQWVFQVCY